MSPPPNPLGSGPFFAFLTVLLWTNSMKLRIKPFKLQATLTALILTISPFFLTLPSKAAGGTITDNGTGTNSNGLGTTTQITNPLSNTIGGLSGSGTNNYSSGSYNFGSYSTGSSCGVQAYLNTNYGNGNASSPISSQNQSSSSSILNGTTSIQTITIGAGIIFNSQKCLDPKKQLETQERLQTNQTQNQLKQTSIQICGPQRTELVKANPTITKERLDEICPL
jgi:hypothetical protein